MTLARGSRVGPYEILDLLGQGGMGAVYRARDPRLDRDVAIKVLRADVIGDRDHQSRFLQEAKAASALNHPNIVTVHDIGAQGDVTYLVMELVDGQPLDQIVAGGALPVGDVIQIGVQVADACARAHATGIVHRDLKPANVMRQADGRVRVLDFGLAKLMALAGSDASGQTITQQTAAGMVLGTAAYMSPEQAEGKPVDGRSDVFSLGAMLYELATGARPFTGDSYASVIASLLREDPPPVNEVRPEVPAELGRVIQRCLRKDPSRRVQSMADLKVALQEVKDEHDSGRRTVVRPAASTIATPAPAAHVATPPSRLMLILATTAVVATLAIAIGLYLRGGQTTTQVDPGGEPPLQAVPLTSYPGAEVPGGFSPDGNQIVFSWDGERQDNSDIYVKVVGPAPPLRLTTDPRAEIRPRWSPDGKQIAFLRFLDTDRVAIVLVSALGGPERSVRELYTRRVLAAGLTSLTWTPDSRSLLVTGGLAAGEPNNLHRIAVASGEIATLVTLPATAEGFSNLSVSPDGRTLGTVRLETSAARQVELFELTDRFDVGSSRVLTSLGTNVGSFAWTADSRGLVYTISVNTPTPLHRVSLDDQRPLPLASLGPGGVIPVISPTAKRLVFGRDVRDANIWRVALDPSGRAAGVPEQIASSSFRDVYPQYSPDGRRLAFYSNRSGSVQIWTADADGSRATPLTSMDPMATTGTPHWSPDSRRIVFDSNAGGAYHIYEIAADGGQPRALTSGATSNFNAFYSPDQRWIYFCSNRSGQFQIWRVPAGGGDAEPVTTTLGEGPKFAPDGQWLYFVRNSGSYSLWRRPTAGGAEERLAERLYRYSFFPTPSGVYFVAQGAGNAAVVRHLDLATRKVTDIVTMDKPPDLGLGLSPDGKYLLFSKLDYVGTDMMLVEGFR